MSPSAKSTTLMSAAMLLLAASASVNVLQAQRIRELTGPRIAAVSPVGKSALPVAGFSVAGQPVKLAMRDAVPTVLYFFSPTCGWCERNWDNVKALVGGSEGRYRVVGVTAERGVRNYLANHKVDMDVVEGIDEATRAYFGLAGTPHTLVVAADGVVTQDWRGAFTPRIKRQIEELFGVLLPGVSSPTSKRPATSQ